MLRSRSRLALAVTYPVAGNLGGGGFLLARFADGRTTFIDFRERAPCKASRDMYLDAEGKLTRDSIDGWRASGVPGTVRGLEFAHKKYGTQAMEGSGCARGAACAQRVSSVIRIGADTHAMARSASAGILPLPRAIRQGVRGRRHLRSAGSGAHAGANRARSERFL